MTPALTPTFLRELSVVAEDENMMARLSKYVHRLFEKRADNTLFTKEEYMRRLEEAELDYKNGNYIEMLPGETLDDMLTRCGNV